MSYAGFWKRFVAVLIDGIILWVVGLFLLVPFLGMLGLRFVDSMMNEVTHRQG